MVTMPHATDIQPCQSHVREPAGAIANGVSRVNSTNPGFDQDDIIAAIQLKRGNFMITLEAKGLNQGQGFMVKGDANDEFR